MPMVPLDPSASEGKTDKWGVNATRKPVSGHEKFQKADLPLEVKAKIESAWETLNQEDA
jgi:3-polyprenyl-4-hydroxybenzoate decarboxylase